MLFHVKNLTTTRVLTTLCLLISVNFLILDDSTVNSEEKWEEITNDDNLPSNKFALIVISPHGYTSKIVRNWSWLVVFIKPTSNITGTIFDCCSILSSKRSSFKIDQKHFSNTFCYSTTNKPAVEDWLLKALTRFSSVSSFFTADRAIVEPFEDVNGLYTFVGSTTESMQRICLLESRLDRFSLSNFPLFSMETNMTTMRTLLQMDVATDVAFLQSYSKKCLLERQRMTSVIKEKYLKPFGRVMNQTTSVNSNEIGRFISIFCPRREEIGDLCGGLGDRFRGMPGMFFTAMITNTIFVLEIMRPVSFGDFFKVNQVWYNVTENVLKNAIEKSKRIPMQHSDAKKITNDSLDSRGFFPHHLFSFFNSFENNPYSFYQLSRGTKYDIFPLLKYFPIFENSNNRVLVNELFPNLNPFKISRIQASVFSSAVLNLGFGHPQKRLVDLFEELLKKYGLDWKIWKNSLTLGVQVRFNRPDFGEVKKSVSPNQLHCFVGKVIKVAKNARKIGQQVIVFVTSDVETTSLYFKQNLRNLAIVIDSNIINKRYHVTTMHLDTGSFSKDPNIRWHQAATAYFDFYILGSLVDMKVVSLSGFSRVASQWSMKPTWVFIHSIPDRCHFHYEFDS